MLSLASFAQEGLSQRPRTWPFSRVPGARPLHRQLSSGRARRLHKTLSSRWPQGEGHAGRGPGGGKGGEWGETCAETNCAERWDPPPPARPPAGILSCAAAASRDFCLLPAPLTRPYKAEEPGLSEQRAQETLNSAWARIKLSSPASDRDRPS